MGKVLTLDPGNSTGFLVYDSTFPEVLRGGTIDTNHMHVFGLMDQICPDVVVYETFQMYPGKAQKLIWNTFYPCEVIGVIKVWAQIHGTTLIGLQPSVKSFAGVDKDAWKRIVPYCDEFGKITEHTRDTLRLFMYWRRYG